MRIFLSLVFSVLFYFKDENLTRIKRRWSFVLIVFNILTSLWFEAGHCPTWSSCWKGPFILITQKHIPRLFFFRFFSILFRSTLNFLFSFTVVAFQSHFFPHSHSSVTQPSLSLFSFDFRNSIENLFHIFFYNKTSSYTKNKFRKNNEGKQD